MDPDSSNIVMGDLNGRTATADDHVADESDDHSPINSIESYQTDTPLQRNNMDISPPDTQGKQILEKCKTLRIRILNGRTNGDRRGAPTRFPLYRSENPSLIDYTICSNSLLPNILSFNINPFNGISDHCCISLRVDASFTAPDENDNILELELTQPANRPSFHVDYVDAYKLNLEKDHRVDELTNMIDTATKTHPNIDQEEVDSWMGKFNDIISANASKSFPKKKQYPKGKKPTKAGKSATWFDNECKKAKNQYKKLTKETKIKPYDRHLQELLIGARKKYRQTCKKAESNFRKKMLKNLLEADDPKTFWKNIQKMKEWGSHKVDPSNSIPASEWTTHFRELLNSTNKNTFQIPSNTLFWAIGRLKEAIPEHRFREV